MDKEKTIATTESSGTGSRFSWTSQSNESLKNAEKKILSCLKTPYKSFYVGIGSGMGQSDWIWTISLNENAEKTPLVLLHGLGAGLALWCCNLDALAVDRPVYAIDLLGFGRSSRPKFSTDPLKVEKQWIDSLEEWRRGIKLSQFIVLGHHLGAYIATAYGVKYPERVRHLIIAGPWGYNDGPDAHVIFNRPLWKRLTTIVKKPFNPLFAVRAAGPAGRWLVSKRLVAQARSEVYRKFSKVVPDAETVIPEYIYQCNSQTPSGESAFYALMNDYGWAKHPMLNRLDQLHPAVPMTVMYGSWSWMLACSNAVMWSKRPFRMISTEVIYGAGHHMYLDLPHVFHKYVLEACAKADKYDPPVETHTIKTVDNNAYVVPIVRTPPLLDSDTPPCNTGYTNKRWINV